MSTTPTASIPGSGGKWSEKEEATLFSRLPFLMLVCADTSDTSEFIKNLYAL